MSHAIVSGTDNQPAQPFEAPPLGLLETPLDYLFADHFRQRRICASLRKLTAASYLERSDASSLSTFLTHDLAQHHQDEDIDVFPALRHRSHPLDDLECILSRLSQEHVDLQPVIDDIVAKLMDANTEPQFRVGKVLADRLHEYVSREQKHVVVENGIVLVMARKRLRRADLASISRSMKARRGLAH